MSDTQNSYESLTGFSGKSPKNDAKDENHVIYQHDKTEMSLSQDFFDETVDILFDRQLKSLGSELLNPLALRDAILSLESHEKRIESVILSKVLLRKDDLYAKVTTLYKLSDSVKQAINYSKKFTEAMRELQKTMMKGFFDWVPYLCLQAGCRKLLRLLNQFHELKYLECLAEKHLKEKKYGRTLHPLLSSQIILCKEGNNLNFHATAMGFKLLERHNQAWRRLEEEVVNNLKVALQHYIEDVRRQSSLQRLHQCLKCLKGFETDDFIKASILNSFHVILEQEVHTRLLKYVDPALIQSTSFDIKTMSCQKLCGHIPKSDYFISLCSVLELFLKTWMAYAELVLWARTNFEGLQLDLYPHLSDSNPSDGTKRTISIPSSSDVTKDVRKTKQPWTVTNLLAFQEDHILMILETFAIQSYCQSFYQFFKIYVCLCRFILEVRETLVKPPNEWETVVAFQDHDSCKDLEISPNLFPKLLGYIKQMVKEYFFCFVSDRIMDLCISLREDSWQRLPLEHQDYHSLLVLPHSIPEEQSFLDLVLYDGAVYPAYSLRKNPFSSWNPTTKWLRHYSFLLKDCQKTQNEPEIKMQSYDSKGSSNASHQPTVFSNGIVISLSGMHLIHTLNRFLQFIYLSSKLKMDIFYASVLLIDLYICVTCHLFSCKRHVSNLVEQINLPKDCYGGAQLHEAHRLFLLQKESNALVILLRFILGLMKQHKVAHVEFQEIFPIHNEDSESVSCYYESLHHHIAVFSEMLRGFNVEPSPCLESPGTLWGIAERVTAVESCVTLVKICSLLFLSSKRSTSWFQLTLREQENYARHVLKIREQALSQMRHFIYRQAVERLFDLQPFIAVVRNWKWDSPNQKLGLDVHQLEVQLKDLQRNMACFNGGSIPPKILGVILQVLGEYAIKCCVEGLAENPYAFPHCQDTSNPAVVSLSRLCQEFRVFLLVLASTLREASQTSTSSQDHGVNTTSLDILDTKYLDHYIEGHSLTGAAAFTWCKLQTDYEVSMLTQLLYKTQPNVSLRKDYITELELCVATTLVKNQRHHRAD